MTRFLRPAPLSLLVAWLAVTALLTLSPDRYTPPLTLESFLCVACGWSGTADIIVNWMMFLPGGALMTMVFAGKRAVVLAVVRQSSSKHSRSGFRDALQPSRT